MTSTRPAILHVECATTYGGSVRCLENFLRYRTGRDCRHLVCLYTPLTERSRLASLCDGLWVAPQRPDWRLSFGSLRRLASLVDRLRVGFWLSALMRRENVRLVRLNNAPIAHIPSLVAVRLAAVPFLAWLRSFPNPTERRWRWLTARTPLLEAMSEAIRRAYILEGVPAERIRTICDGTEVPLPETARQASRAVGEFRIGTLGRLVAWKGLLELVRAAPLVLREHPQARFELVGNEDPLEAGFKSELLAEIERVGVQQQVTISGFRVDPREFVLSLDCLANPSFPAEPFGMSIVEAMALGCPVIATAGGGPAEIIEDGVSGLLVPTASPDALATAILRLIRNPVLRVAMGREARRRVAERFEVRRQVMEQEELLRRALLGGPGIVPSEPVVDPRR